MWNSGKENRSSRPHIASWAVLSNMDFSSKKLCQGLDRTSLSSYILALRRPLAWERKGVELSYKGTATTSSGPCLWSRALDSLLLLHGWGEPTFLKLELKRTSHLPQISKVLLGSGSGKAGAIQCQMEVFQGLVVMKRRQFFYRLWGAWHMPQICLH